jgi:protein translocase SecG subunit
MIVVALIIVLMVVCVLLVGSILLQEDKSGGGMGFLGGSSQSFFGASSGSILSRISSVLLVVFLLMGLVIALLASQFTSKSTIDETDITETEVSEYDIVNRKQTIDFVPEKIQRADFENSIIDKLEDDEDKTFVQDAFELDKQEKYYELKKKLRRADNQKMIRLLNKAQFSLEAQVIEFDEE